MVNFHKYLIVGKIKRSIFIFIANSTVLWSTVTSGVVLDQTNGKPIASAIITANGKEYRTDLNGHFSVPPSSVIGVRAVGYERISTEENGTINLRPFYPKALYLSSFGATSSKIMNNAKRLIHNTEINALVIDIKMDRGQIAFHSSDPTAKAIGAQKMVRFSDLKQFISGLKQEGIYTIARIVTFKDTPFVASYPRLGVHYQNGSLYKDREGLFWIDPSQKEAWKYIVNIAEESAQAGFDEIQFDYVRFPDKRGLMFAVKNSQSQRVKSISDFLAYARARLTSYNVFISADIFGYVCWNNADLGIGQRVDAISSYVDYISPMLYPSGFQVGIPGYKNPVKANYQIVRNSLEQALKKSGGSPLAFRPWLQAFRDYAFDRRNYGEQEIREQIRASEDFGSNGWMLWNPRNLYGIQGLIRTGNAVVKND
ncbi:MAG: GTP-binding protein [Campylobacterales bacterium]|nr:GTP-binding protein [Campylobacterales bacterium]